MKRDPIPYAPGHFTALIREFNFPPGFVAGGSADGGASKRSAAAARGRQTQLARGNAWSIDGGLSKSSAAMVSRPEKGKVSAANPARARAFVAGQPRYWNDNPCHAGHVGWRYTLSYACCECMAAGAKAGRRADGNGEAVA